MSLESRKRDEFLQRAASESGVAIVLTDGHGRELSAANNNSICRLLYPSPDFGPRCAEYCGRAFEAAFAAGKPVDYECHAGLACKAVPLPEMQLVAIVGRTFLKADNYRKATEKAIMGEWKRFRPTEIFDNILISGSEEHLERAARRMEKLTLPPPAEPDVLEIMDAHGAGEQTAPPAEEEPAARTARTESETADAREQPGPKVERRAPKQEPPAVGRSVSEWRSLLGSLMRYGYREACGVVLEFISRRYQVGSLIWLERRNGDLGSVAAVGKLAKNNVRFAINAGDEKLLIAARRDLPVVLRERAGPGEARSLQLFPMIVGGEVRGAVAIESEIADMEKKQSVARFVQTVASQVEILRLRDEVEKRDWLARAINRFNENLSRIDADDFWTRLTQMSAEFLNAERASLLVKSERSDALQARAAIGAPIDLRSETEVGKRVARAVLSGGDAVVVGDINRIGIGSAPGDRRYKTSSFISYPIVIGDRPIGVLNFTDKAGGDTFDDRDLELLRAIGPQIAVAIDRLDLKQKAGEFEQLSVTDPLTGLLNRRYLDERVAEEIARSKRYGSATSLMMIDVDDFKAYNDTFGHPAGDAALKVVGDVLKDTLRSADVAARYGGEEFAVLLPQTTRDEAAQIGERLRLRIEAARFPERSVTISVGIADQTAETMAPEDLISKADMALYKAKRMGRNNVQVYMDAATEGRTTG